MKALFTLLLLVGFIFWLASNEVKLQYTTYQQTYIKNVECRMAETERGYRSYLHDVCGPIPTLP